MQQLAWLSSELGYNPNWGTTRIRLHHLLTEPHDTTTLALPKTEVCEQIRLSKTLMSFKSPQMTKMALVPFKTTRNEPLQLVQSQLALLEPQTPTPNATICSNECLTFGSDRLEKVCLLAYR